MPESEDSTEGEWQVVGATVAGRSHRTAGKGNEDALAVGALPGGGHVLALADGAGSAAQAAEGAQLVVSAAVELVLANSAVGASLLLEVVTDLRRLLAVKARSSRLPPRQFASTLLLALVDGARVSALQLGDGAIVVQDEDGWSRLTAPQRGEYASETSFLTSPGAHRRAKVVSRPLDGVRSLSLLTDGLEPLALDIAGDRPFAPFFDPLAGFARSGGSEEDLREFLQSDRVQARAHDDLSLILAVRSR